MKNTLLIRLEGARSVQRSHALGVARDEFYRHSIGHDDDAIQARAAALRRFTHGQTRRDLDPEKEQMKQEIATLRAAVNDISKVLHQVAIQHTPGVSFLDEMLASLEQKQDVVVPLPLPESLLDALSDE